MVFSSHKSGQGRFIHKNRGTREPLRHSLFWEGKRKMFAKQNVVVILLLSFLFLGNLCYFYATTIHQSVNVHHMKLLVVDYDGGVVGKALHATYERLRGDGFPTLESVSSADYPTVDSLRNKVCRDPSIWGAVFTHDGASTRLSNALQSGSAAQSYNPAAAMTYIWNGARYTTASLPLISANLERLILQSGASYSAINGTYAYGVVNGTDPRTTRVLATPFIPSNINIMPTTQGTRALYNTITLVFTVVSQFFYVMALNGIASSLGMYTRLSILQNTFIRWMSSLLYTSTLSAVITGAIWGFRDTWSVTASQGVETWLCLWFACHIHFLIMDTATGFLPPQGLPFAVLTWVIANTASTATPLPLAPAFYHWEHALPSFNIYQLLVTIWSNGCVPQLSTALPILFTWWILGVVGSWLSMIKKCNAATKFEEELEEHWEEKIEPISRVATADAKSPIETEDYEANLQRFKSRANGVVSVPDALYWSTRTPFSDTLNLTPTKTLSEKPTSNPVPKVEYESDPSLREQV